MRRRPPAAAGAPRSLDAADVRLPSLLPGWTVGHVLTHVARNADSFVRMLEGVERGEIVDQYEGGVGARAADIEAGAGRPAGELVHDVRGTIWRFEGHGRADQRRGTGRRGSFGDGPVDGLPFRRWREVEVHHADLGLPGFTFADWSSAYVRRELQRELMTWRSRKPMGFSDLPPAALALSAEPAVGVAPRPAAGGRAARPGAVALSRRRLPDRDHDAARTSTPSWAA